jgi:hypothetical protein
MNWNYRIVIDVTSVYHSKCKVAIREVRYNDMGQVCEIPEPIVLERDTNVKALIAQLNLILEDIKCFPPIDERPKYTENEEVPI